MKCAIFLADGFETCEALITVDLLRRAKIEIDMISMNKTLRVCTSHGVRMEADRLYEDIDVSDYDVLILPGGKVGTENLEKNESLKAAYSRHFEEGKLSAAICAAPSIPGHMGLLKGRKYCCFPTFDEKEFGGFFQNVLTVRDGNLITGRGMAAAMDFALEIIRTISGEEMADQVKTGIQYGPVFE